MYTSVLLRAFLAQTQQHTIETRLTTQAIMTINPAAADAAAMMMVIVLLSSTWAGRDDDIRTEVDTDDSVGVGVRVSSEMEIMINLHLPLQLYSTKMPAYIAHQGTLDKIYAFPCDNYASTIQQPFVLGLHH